MMTKLKISLALSGIAVLLYFLWPAIVWTIQMSLFRVLLDYGIYAFLLLAGGGWLWWKLR